MAKKPSQLHTALRRPVDIEANVSRKTSVEIVHARLQASQVLSIADENDRGTDPYNNTGQHATLGAVKKF